MSKNRAFFKGDQVVAVYCMTGRHARGRIVQPGLKDADGHTVSYVVEIYIDDVTPERHLIGTNSIALIKRGTNEESDHQSDR